MKGETKSEFRIVKSERGELVAGKTGRGRGNRSMGQTAQNATAGYHSEVADNCQGYEGNFEQEGTEATEKTEDQCG